MATSSLVDPTLTTATPTSLISASSSSQPIPTEALAEQRGPYITTTISSIIVCLTLVFVLVYFAVFSWGYRASKRDPKALNKRSGSWFQSYAPDAYGFLALNGLIELALSSWLILQYRFNHNYPRVAVRTGCRLILVTSCWTFATATVYTLLFFHPTWSKHPVSSVGTQTVWLSVTLVLWIIGAGLVNGAVPSAIDKSRCDEVVYCFQIRLLFGLAVVESLAITAAIVAMVWLARQSARQATKRPSLRPLSMVPLSTIMEAFDRPRDAGDT